MLNNVERLKDTIRVLYRCEARHIDSVRLQDTFSAQLAWDGVVEIFELDGCDESSHCFAWNYREHGITKSHAILSVNGVNSAQAAVRSTLNGFLLHPSAGSRRGTRRAGRRFARR